MQPLEIFDLIATELGHIRHIALNFELGCLLRIAPRDRHRLNGRFAQVTESTARQIFYYIRSRANGAKISSPQTPFLESMTISRGSRDRPDKAFLLTHTGKLKRPWARFNTLSLHVSLLGRDSQGGSGFVNVSCPELEVMRSISRNSDVASSNLESAIRLVADSIRNGPQQKFETVLNLPDATE